MRMGRGAFQAHGWKRAPFVSAESVMSRVGVPAKGGVVGGIMAVVPTRMGIGIYSPALDAKGNSLAGIHLLEKLSRELYLSVF